MGAEIAWILEERTVDVHANLGTFFSSPVIGVNQKDSIDALPSLYRNAFDSSTKSRFSGYITHDFASEKVPVASEGKEIKGKIFVTKSLNLFDDVRRKHKVGTHAVAATILFLYIRSKILPCHLAIIGLSLRSPLISFVFLFLVVIVLDSNLY
jgi:hypothetical protein